METMANPSGRGGSTIPFIIHMRGRVQQQSECAKESAKEVENVGQTKTLEERAKENNPKNLRRSQLSQVSRFVLGKVISMFSLKGSDDCCWQEGRLGRALSEFEQSMEEMICLALRHEQRISMGNEPTETYTYLRGKGKLCKGFIKHVPSENQ